MRLALCVPIALLAVAGCGGGDATPGTYTVVVTCANKPQPVGEASFEVTA